MNQEKKNPLVDVDIKIVGFSYCKFFAQCLRGCCKKSRNIFPGLFFLPLEVKGGKVKRPEKVSIHL